MTVMAKTRVRYVGHSTHTRIITPKDVEDNNLGSIPADLVWSAENRRIVAVEDIDPELYRYFKEDPDFLVVDLVDEYEKPAQESAPAPAPESNA